MPSLLVAAEMRNGEKETIFLTGSPDGLSRKPVLCLFISYGLVLVHSMKFTN